MGAIHVIPDSRDKVPFTVLAAANRTATTTGADFVNHSGVGIMLMVDASTVASTETVTPSVQIKDPISAEYLTITGFTAISTAGNYIFYVCPGASEDAAITNVQIQSLIIPYNCTFRVVMTHSASGTHNYSVVGWYVF